MATAGLSASPKVPSARDRWQNNRRRRRCISGGGAAIFATVENTVPPARHYSAIVGAGPDALLTDADAALAVPLVSDSAWAWE